MGLFSTGVLNLNNTRDIENDKQSGKNTIAVKLGPLKSRIYHTSLILLAWIALIVFTLQQQKTAWQWLFLLVLPVSILDLVKIFRIKDSRQLDPFLKRLALQTLALTLLFSLGLILT